MDELYGRTNNDKILCQMSGYPHLDSTIFYKYRKYGALFVTTLALGWEVIVGQLLKTLIGTAEMFSLQLIELHKGIVRLLILQWPGVN
jgi:hypothetical protein